MECLFFVAAVFAAALLWRKRSKLLARGAADRRGRGRCGVCGQWCSPLQRDHDECRELTNVCVNAALGRISIAEAERHAAQVKGPHRDSRVRAATIAAYASVLDKALDDQFLSAAEEETLTRFASATGLRRVDADFAPLWIRTTQAGAIRDIARPCEGRPAPSIDAPRIQNLATRYVMT